MIILFYIRPQKKLFSKLLDPCNFLFQKKIKVNFCGDFGYVFLGRKVFYQNVLEFMIKVSYRLNPKLFMGNTVGGITNN